MTSIGFSSHDHGACIADGLAAAREICAKQNLHLTPTRARVLEILLAEHRALGAYDILDILRAEGASAQPPVAYRALDFLVKAGLAHRIERLNAFVACSHIGRDHAPVFLICTKCRKVGEASGEAASRLSQGIADGTGFKVERTLVEIEGLCPACQDAA